RGRPARPADRAAQVRRGRGRLVRGAAPAARPRRPAAHRQRQDPAAPAACRRGRRAAGGSAVTSAIRHVDTLVVGSGLNGCALAYYLTSEGITDVLVTEADEHGAGATGGSMGNVRQQFGTPLELECSRRGLAFWKSVEATFGLHCPFHQDGYLMVTGDEGT